MVYVTIAEDTDWIGVYVQGWLRFEGKTLRKNQWIDLLDELSGKEFTLVTVEVPDWVWEMFPSGLPQNLGDLAR